MRPWDALAWRRQARLDDRLCPPVICVGLLLVGVLP